MIILPKKITFKRYLKLSRPNRSLLRDLMHERLSDLEVKGKCLDVGGGKLVDYRGIVKYLKEPESINFDPKIKSTYLHDLNFPMPFENEIYDNITCFNTLEHLYEDDLALFEIYRVLKKGGNIYIFLPFLYRVHGSPDDYHRHTADEWSRKIKKLGVDESKFIIEPIVWDVYSTGYSFFETIIPYVNILLRPLFLFPGLLHSKLFSKNKHRWSNFALGYFITINK